MFAEYSLRIIMAQCLRKPTWHHKEKHQRRMKLHQMPPFQLFCPLLFRWESCHAGEFPAWRRVCRLCAGAANALWERSHLKSSPANYEYIYTTAADCVGVFFSRCRPFLYIAASVSKQRFDHANNELQVIGHLIGLAVRKINEAV